MTESKTVVKKESKNKIRVEFDRTPWLVRMKTKIFNMYFLKNVVWGIVRYVLLIGISYVVLYPFITWILDSFKSAEDVQDVTVGMLSQYPTFDQYKYIVTENGFFQVMLNTLVLSLLVAVIQTLVCSLIAYGLAKFKFKGSGLLFVIVLVTLMIPHATLERSLFLHFTYDNIFGKLFNLLGLREGVSLINTFWPTVLMCVTGLYYKNGLYIFMLRQFFKGVPDELEESAYVDGSGVFRTFFSIILPLSIPMLVTVFVFSFAWQWTDTFYTDLFFTLSFKSGSDAIKFLADIAYTVPTTLADGGRWDGYEDKYVFMVQGTSGLMIIAPLVIVYVFLQRYLVQGIERTGLVG
ncbi:MAG: carbohydrate ABC transporter permease [Clostridia bacterium]|nr:carbohydrate ABC transporter permease [Clostridia bacterium]